MRDHCRALRLLCAVVGGKGTRRLCAYVALLPGAAALWAAGVAEKAPAVACTLAAAPAWATVPLWQPRDAWLAPTLIEG